MNFKEINIGILIQKRVAEYGTEMSRICNFMKCSEEEIQQMYQSKSLDSEILLKWSKLLEYDFFRVYSQHLILYAPSSAIGERRQDSKKSVVPHFRKNIYTQEIIDFILDQVQSEKMTRNEIMERYRIPKTTLYKWINKYGDSGKKR